MAGSVNKVILVGRVGKDPEFKRFENGGEIANFSLATSESWRDKRSGERKEKTQWHQIVVKNEGLIKVIDDYVKKGDLLYIEGQLETRKYDKDGKDHYTTEVVLSGFNSSLTMLTSPNGGGDNDRDNDRGGDDRGSRGSDRGNDRNSGGRGNDRGGDRGGDRGSSNARSSDRGSDDRGSRGGRGSRDDDRSNDRGGGSSRNSGRSSSRQELDDEIPF